MMFSAVLGQQKPLWTVAVVNEGPFSRTQIHRREEVEHTGEPVAGWHSSMFDTSQCVENLVKA